jgi:hypothetical protein
MLSGSGSRPSRHAHLASCSGIECAVIVADCSDLIAKLSLNPGNARDVVVKVLLGEQPLRLKGGTLPGSALGSWRQHNSLTWLIGPKRRLVDVCYSAAVKGYPDIPRTGRK